MAMTQMQLILIVIILVFVVCCNCQSIDPGASSSWAKLQISPDTLSSMEYGNFLIEIYEHANNHKASTTASQKKYFYSPLALLDHNSAVSIFNNVTKQPEMRFRVEMWNAKVQNEVVKHLNKSIGQEIQSDKVRVIPLEKVILTSNTPTADYSLSPVWTIYDKRKTLWFSLSCYDLKICNKLANEMRSNPQQFDHFKLLYSLSSQTSQTKQTTISIESVTSGQMVTALLQKFEDKKEIFLTANDEKKMLAEMATKFRMDTFDDSEVWSPDTESQILKIFRDLLVKSSTTIKEQSDKMWDSVFWNEDNYRPDKTTKTLNEIINKLDKETQRILADMFQNVERQSQMIEKLTSSNKDTEKRREEQLRPENESKDANAIEMRRSQVTDHQQFSRNQTRDDKSTTSRDDTDITVDGVGSDDGIKIATNNSHTHNTDQQNERKENAKENSDEYDRKMKNKERIQHNYDSNSWADVDRISLTISGKMAIDSDNSRRIEIVKEEVKKLLQESRDHVQWDEEKFGPKTMQLSRINLDKFRDSQSFQDRNVRVRYTTAELSAPIKFIEHAELTATDEWNNLKEELKENRELLKTAGMNLAKTNNELGNVKSDLINTRIELASKLEATRKEMMQTKIDLEKTAHLREMTVKTVDDLTAELNVTQKELAEMKINTGNFSMELEETVMSLAKTNTELGNMKSDLTNTRIDLASKLEGTLVKTNNEMEKTNTIFRKTVDDLSKKLIGFEKELAEKKMDVGKFSLELKANLQRFGYELKTADDNLRKELRATSNDLETTTTNLASARMELSNTKSAVSELTTKLNARTNEIVDIGKMPTSCWDLQRMGQKINGFFLVKGLKKMETVYCDFYPNQNDKQKWIGYADVKSAPVHFYVQRNSPFFERKTPIPFELARVNEGNAMNLTSGILTASRTGTYFFSFTGLGRFTNSSSLLQLAVGLYLNADRIGLGYVEEANTVNNQWSPLTLQSTLNLKKDDRVWVQIDGWTSGSFLVDSPHHHTHFTGFMLGEEIVASL
ncbi:uncharacterized protein LOC124203584 [Daphnia pulex]|uniref:uncharacterized protein LOC124203584 n=1 Tax=Daphnia pulex TaxID=6669 RepID=UPI001EDF6A82|nr:uncharacterized protein LOC124203584 [Daphnia pulex]